MIQLYTYPSTAAMIPRILLEELGVPYEAVLVDRTRDAHKAPEYLKFNPNGLIPVLTDGDLVLYETAAIVLHLCDTHPEAGLIPSVGSAERAQFYKWLIWFTNTLQVALITYFYPERSVDEGNAEGVAQVKAQAQARVIALLDQVEAQLAGHGQPWFGGKRFSALDPYVFTLCRWTRNFPSGKARDRDVLATYLQCVLERPAVQRVMQADGIATPFY